MTTFRSSIDEHPDLLAMRAKYERAAESVTVQGALGVSILLSVYVAISPWILNFAGTTPLGVIDLITGIAAAVLALGFSSVLSRTHGVMWTLPVLGLWTIAAPWAHMGGISPNVSMITSNVVAGGLIAGLGAIAAGIGLRAATAR